jgi:hypothetical protein
MLEGSKTCQHWRLQLAYELGDKGDRMAINIQLIRIDGSGRNSSFALSG